MNSPAIRFTAHALEKLGNERALGFPVDEDLVRGILLSPHQLAPARDGRSFAQSPVDERHLLQVLFEEEVEGFVLITVYIAARTQYEI